MTMHQPGFRAEALVARALVTDRIDRLPVGEDFTSRVLRSASRSRSRARRLRVPVIVVLAASVLTVSTAAAGIARFFRAEKPAGVAACVGCAVEAQYLIPSPDGNPFQATMARTDTQATFRDISVTEDLKISNPNYKFFDLRVSATGVIASFQVGDGPAPLRIFSPTGQELPSLGQVIRPGLTSTYWGWVGDSVWVMSRSSMLYVVEVGPTPRLVRMRFFAPQIPGPPGTSPQPSRYAFARAGAAYPNGDLLITQSFPEAQARAAPGLPDAKYLSGKLHVRVSPEHQFVSAIPSRLAEASSNPCRVEDPAPGIFVPIAMTLPWCDPWEEGLSPDGRLIVYSATRIPVTDPTIIRVVQVAVGGDTVFARDYRIPAWRITTAMVDSIRSANVDRTSLLEPRLHPFKDSILRTAMPAYRQPVDAVTVGNDGSVLLHLFLHTPERRYLLIDSRGDPVGTFALPPGVLAIEVNRNTVWAVTPRSDEYYHIVRYKIGQ